MKKVVILTGAGISAESGISTFRGSDGLWEGYDIMEVASPRGWKTNPELVLEFYNQRRRQLKEVKPNAGHLAINNLCEYFEVQIITQNVDNLHERAGNPNIIHLHGQLDKVRSCLDEKEIYDWHGDLTVHDKCSKGIPLRPHIVWFGEMVPMIEIAIETASQADYFIVVGTSMGVYPAASLIEYVPSHCKKFLIDPNHPEINLSGIQYINQPASIGVPIVVDKIIANA